MDIHSNPTLQIEYLAKEKLEVFKSSIRQDGTYRDPIYRSAQSTGHQIASDYGSRFLVELVQNAYDAHSPERNDGEIKILLAPEEGTTGVLYVANKGNGFTWNDVEALCNIGMSNKPVGESIGNKGLGFRSVRYITDDPQIYSKVGSSKTGSFDGYCFRFAHEDDFDRLLQEPNHQRLGKKDIPQFHIPIPVTVYPETVHTFEQEGFSTVVRLPLRNPFALQAVVKEIEALHNNQVPLLLFLQRLRALDVAIQGDSERSFCVTRLSKQLQIASNTEINYRFTIVNLNNEESYFISWYMIPEHQVKQAIDDSIQQHQLHPSWTDWKGDGELAAAVRIDDGTVSPRMYTFLPMGEQAECPFYGYLHGAFYPKADRTSLDVTIPVNNLYVKEAAKLCARTILVLRQVANPSRNILSQKEFGQIIVDLLAWKQVADMEGLGASKVPELIGNALADHGYEFAEADILPIVPRIEGCWGKASELWHWDKPDLKIFGVESLVKIADVAILSPVLGNERIDRLQEFIYECGDYLILGPTDEQLAEIAEKVAFITFKPRASKRILIDYYLELEQIFRSKPASLSKRKILYCTDGILHSAMSAEPEPEDLGSAFEYTEVALETARKRIRRRSRRADTPIFSPSKRLGGEVKGVEDTGQIMNVPKELTKSFAFLDDKLDWHGDLEKVRDFLENNKLVRRYDADDLVAQASLLVRQRRRVRTLQAALLWVFRLWRSSKKTQRPISLRSARLFVPTLEGRWLEANKAIFSASWPSKTLGTITEEFLSQTGSYSDELQRLNGLLLSRRNTKPFSSKGVEEWADFLCEIGVSKGLQPLPIDTANFKPSGWSLSSMSICDSYKLGDALIQYWKRDIEETGEKPSYLSSQYQLEGRFWYFPGQMEYSTFSSEAKLLFAQLILNWLETAEQDKIKVTIFTPSARWASRFKWPTPLVAFLRQANWFPVETPDGTMSGRSFVKPSEVWLSNIDDDRLPPYLPRTPRGLRSLISSELIHKRLVEWCEVNVLNAPNSLIKQVGFLAKLFVETGIDPYHSKSFMNLYNETWERLANSKVEAQNVRPYLRYLITRRSGQLTSVDISLLHSVESVIADNGSDAEDQSEIFVRDSGDSLGVGLIDKMGLHIFDSGTKNVAAVALILKDLLGASFRAVSDFKYVMLIDGEEYDHSRSEEPFAVNQCPWLPTVVYLAMESLTGTTAQHLPADRSEIISRLHNIRLRMAGSIRFRVNSQLVELLDKDYGAVAIRDPFKPTLIIQCDPNNMEWTTLARASNQLSQLLEQVDLGPPILVCFRTLERLEKPVVGPIPADKEWVNELCNELNVDRRYAEEALAGLGRDIRRLIMLLRPVVHYFGGMGAVDSFTKMSEQTQTLPDLVSLLEPHLADTGLTAEVVINVCQRAIGFGFIREELALLFGKFNKSLMALGEEPDIHIDAHVEAIHTYVTLNKNMIMGCLRTPFIDKFRNHQSITDYVQLREEVETLDPKHEWLIEYQLPDTQMIKDMIDEWLSKHSAPIMSEGEGLLPPWSEVRVENRLRIKRLVQSHNNKIKAWCFKNHVKPPADWNDISTAENLCNTLNGLGALDFEYLNEDDLISWLVIVNAWPEGMPRTLVLDELGLKETDLDEQKNREQAARLQREKEARSIIFNKRIIDPQEVDHDSLASEINANLSAEITASRLDHMATLKTMPAIDQKRSTSSGRGGGGARRRLHPDKTDLIGFIGECTVYHWLKRQFPKQDIDAAWVSSYRSRLLPGNGDDSCGYDFKIRYRRKLLYLEVKSSLTDPLEFELGDTEIRLARDCSTMRGAEYRVIYVSNVQDPISSRLDILPNPLSDDGKHFFRIGGHGLRYEFLRVI